MQDVVSISNKYTGCKMIILGDYNLPDMKWHSSRGDDEFFGESVQSDVVMREFSLLGLSQINKIHNANGKYLDLSFTNCDLTFRKLPALVPEDNFHPTIGTEILLNQLIKPRIAEYLDFKRGDYGALNNFFLQHNWIPMYELKNIDDIVSYFYRILQKGIDLFVPRSIKKDSNYPCWFNRCLINKIKAKRAAHTRYKNAGSYGDYQKFSELRKECKQLCIKCYDDFTRKAEAAVNSDPAYFWKFLRMKRSSDNGIPSSMEWNDNKAEGAEEVCNLFAEFFSSIYGAQGPLSKQERENIMEDSKCGQANLNVIEIKFDELLKGLLSLDTSKGPGPDGISNFFLKECSVGLCEPLSFIFDKSLRWGVFPDAWKDAYVVPIFKSGSKNDAGNYRQVCIQSALPKFFEKTILGSLEFWFKGFLINQQHGFTKGRSTVSNLLVYTEYIMRHLSERIDVHALYTDFSKAFDMVNHEVLLLKLGKYGLSGNLLNWFASYLKGRRLRVKISDYISKEFCVSSGVPQGSHLGPILFCIFVNDIGCSLMSKYSLFADDSKIFRCIKDNSDMYTLQEDIDKLARWCNLNRLKLNVKKCAIIKFCRGVSTNYHQYYIGNDIVPQVDGIRDLGIHVDSKLTYEGHITNISAKASKVLGSILRSSNDFRNDETLVKLFNSLVRPILEYGCIVWDPIYNYQTEKIEKVQRQFIRHMRYRNSCRNIIMNRQQAYEHTGCKLLQDRRKYLTLCFGANLINGYLDVPELVELLDFVVPNTSLRIPRVLSVPKAKSCFSTRAPLYRISTIINEYATMMELYGESINALKRAARNLVL